MIAYRKATEADSVFVVSSWETSYRRSNSAGLITAEDWAGVMRAQLAKILARPYTTTLVAYESDDPEFVYGYAVGEGGDNTPPILLWVYTKAPYRRQGLATSLMRRLGIDYHTHFDYVCSTPATRQLLRNYHQARWSPELGRYSREHRRKEATAKADRR